MCKYFKEEETSNRIKRFKTSDFQEKNSRFAQVSRVTTLLDGMLDFTKTRLFRILFRAPALLKVKPHIKEALKEAFLEIIKANMSAVFKIKRDMQPILEIINAAKIRQAELEKYLSGLTDSKKRNEAITELEKIKKILIDKEKELEPFKKDYAEIEKNAKSEINAKIEEFNRVNDLTSPMSWNQDLANPKIEFLLGVPVSKRGTGAVMDRAREKQPLNVHNFLNQFRRGAAQKLDGFLTQAYTNKLNSIGFFDKKYKFKVLVDDKWVDKKYSMGDLFEEINKGGFKGETHKPLDETVKAKIIADFKKFNEESDKIERGVLSPAGRSVITGVISLTAFSPVWIPMLATSPQRIQKQQNLKDPNKMPNEMKDARKNLSIGQQEEKKIAELESLLQNPTIPESLKVQFRASLARLKGKNNGR